MTKSFRWLMLLVVYVFLLRFFSAWLFNHVSALAGIILITVLFFAPIHWVLRKVDFLTTKEENNEEV
jgi:hypothetical protein